MQQSLIYHGGGMGRGGGFSGAGGGSSDYLYDRLWIPADDFFGYTGSVPNGPATRILPNTIAARAWTFPDSALRIVFTWFSLPSQYWTYVLSGTTGLTVRVYYYVDVAGAGLVIMWKASLSYVRHNETLNFTPPTMADISGYAGTAYALHVNTQSDFTVYDPAGSATETEGAFYLKIERDGTDGGDTYGNEAHFLGASVDIPLKFS